MDPATIVGLVSSCLSLATQIGSTIKGLNDLRNKYKAVEQNTISLISQVNIVRSSVDLLAQWLQNPSRRKLLMESENSLKAAIDCCAIVIDGISKHVSDAKEQPDETATFKNKFLRVWNESTINDHVRRLDSQIGSITLWLQVSRFTNTEQVASVLQEETSIHIFQAARDDAASYSQTSLSLNRDRMTRISAEFAFDNLVIRSGPYVQHYRDMTRKIARRRSNTMDIENAMPAPATKSQPAQSDSLTASPLLLSPKPNSFGKGVRHHTSSILGALGLGGQDRREHSKSLLIVLSRGKENIQRIQQLIEQGADPNYKSEDDGEAVLHKAARAGYSQAIYLLTSNQAKVNLKNKNGESPLMIATKVALDPVNALIHAGAKLNLKNNNGWTALHIAANNSPSGVLEALLGAGASVNEKTYSGRTPLHFASYRCNASGICSLLAANAWVNVRRGIKGHNSRFLDETPLHMVCGSPNMDKGDRFTAVKLLIEAGADCDAEAMVSKALKSETKGKLGTESALTALHMATEGSHSNIIRLLLDAGADPSAEFPVEISGNYSYIVKYTAIHIAAANNSKSVLQKLVRALGHGLTTVNNSKNTNSKLVKSAPKGLTDVGSVWEPLHTAVLCGAHDTASYLLKRSRQHTETNTKLGTPLHIAAFQGYAELVELLLQNNGETTARTASKRTPLHHAVIGAIIGQYDGSYTTHLRRLRKPDHLAAISLLLENGADVDARDKDGETPLCLACAFSSPSWRENDVARSVAEILLKYGADVQTLNGDEEDLMTQAWCYEDDDLMKFLTVNGLPVSEFHYDTLWKWAKSKRFYNTLAASKVAKLSNPISEVRVLAVGATMSRLNAVIREYTKMCAVLDTCAETAVKRYGKSLASQEKVKLKEGMKKMSQKNRGTHASNARLEGGRQTQNQRNENYEHDSLSEGATHWESDDYEFGPHAEKTRIDRDQRKANIVVEERKVRRYTLPAQREETVFGRRGYSRYPLPGQNEEKVEDGQNAKRELEGESHSSRRRRAKFYASPNSNIQDSSKRPKRYRVVEPTVVSTTNDNDFRNLRYEKPRNISPVNSFGSTTSVVGKFKEN